MKPQPAPIPESEEPKVSREDEMPGTRRSGRERKPTKKYIALLVPFLLALMTTTTAVPEINIRENSLFYKCEGIAFSESSWTIVTDLDLSPIDGARAYLEEKIADQLAMTISREDGTYWRVGDVDTDSQRLASERITARMRVFTQKLDYAAKRLATFKHTIAGSNRSRRTIIAFAGYTLKWLFGLATQRDLEGINEKIRGLTTRQDEITHLLQQQVTVVNESLWEVRTTTLMMGELRLEYQALLLAINEVKDVFTGNFLTITEFGYFTHLSATFDAMETVLQWIHHLANDLDIGLGMLARGRLAPQIFPPIQLEIVLDQIKQKLPLGWSLSGEDLWTIYQEAEVSVAMADDRLRLFIRIPIVDSAQRYSLFRIISLPSPAKNATFGVTFARLPDYLAVTPDLEAFVELSEAQVEQCTKTDPPLCKFRSGISKKTSLRSCAMALFIADEAQREAQCSRKFAEWKGSQAVYLGNNRWVSPSMTSQEVVVSCPTLTGRTPFETITLPPVGILDLPSGCTARSNDWVLPASTQGKFGITLGPIKMPNVDIMSFSPKDRDQLHPGIGTSARNRSALDRISELLNRNAIVLATDEMTDRQIDELLAETQRAADAIKKGHYPIEFWACIALLFFALAMLTFAALNLHIRLAAHEREADNIQMIPQNIRVEEQPNDLN